MWVAVLALLVASCDPTPSTSETASTIAPVSTSTTVPATTTTTEPPEPFTYRVGVTEPPSTDNFWFYFDPQSTLSDRYVLGQTKPSLYAYDPPGFELAPYLAESDAIPGPVETDDGWEVVVDLEPGAVWSDGVPITADDIVFTFETVRDVGLRGGWSAVYPAVESGSPQLGLVDVSAVDADTVRFRYNGRPGLPFWPNGPGTAPIMPRHHWRPIVADALTTPDPALTLTTASGAGDPSGGPVVIGDVDGDLTTLTPNPNWVRSGTTVRSGGSTYELGPFFETMTVQSFADQSSASTALVDGDIDVVLNSAGIDQRLADHIAGADGVEVIRNPVNGFRYLAFNLRRSPTAEPGFRRALDLLNDRDAVVGQVFGPGVEPALVSIPAGNTRWFNREIVEELTDESVDLGSEQRLKLAVDELSASGFSWERPPRFENGAVEPPSPILLAGEPVRPLELLAPGSGFDPLRSTYALWIARWLEDLGFTITVRFADFASIVGRVFTPTEDGSDIDFDMVVLGWRLPSPAVPLHHASFWSSANDTLTNDGNNNTGFRDARFDAFVQEYNAATDAEAAYAIVWEMERILHEVKPYLFLYDVDVVEAYRNDRVRYPFVEVLSGLQSVAGLPAAVQPAEPS